MLNEPQAIGVKDAIVASFPDAEARVKPEQLEAVMRPFAPITHETQHRIDVLLTEAGVSLSVRIYLGPWFEANEVAEGGDDPHVERRIRFLLMDTCTCVLDHLPTAIAEAEKRGKTVDPRVKKLLDHDYLKKKKPE